MDIQVLYQDADVAVILKPAGVVVNDAETVSTPTIQQWWVERLKAEYGGALHFPDGWQALVPADFSTEFGTPEEIFAERGGIVHRLDKETSGALLLAKNPGSLVNLLVQFRQRQTQKKYLCLVHGKFKILEDTVSLPISRSPANRTRYQVIADGRKAETAYKVINYFPKLDIPRLMEIAAKTHPEFTHIKQKVENRYQGFSLVECWPKTGRTHQIRVHFTHLRHPLVADPTYVGAKRLHLDSLWCSRLFLHALTLGWQDPRTGESRSIEAPLPPELEEALTFLQES
jgi:23S rRNA pseudouridine1911/1915/1917 synthase